MVRIIDYKAGNAPSVLHAVTRLGYNAALVNRPAELSDVTHIILPGVGSVGARMESLRGLGFIGAMEEGVLRRKTLFHGICVGLQILFDHSEGDNTDCLGWLHSKIVRFDESNVRVLQMGWNQVRLIENVSFGAGDDYFYFVNSYYAKPGAQSDIWVTADYNGTFAADIISRMLYSPRIDRNYKVSELKEYLFDSGVNMRPTRPKEASI